MQGETGSLALQISFLPLFRSAALIFHDSRFATPLAVR